MSTTQTFNSSSWIQVSSKVSIKVDTWILETTHLIVTTTLDWYLKFEMTPTTHVYEYVHTRKYSGLRPNCARAQMLQIQWIETYIIGKVLTSCIQVSWTWWYCSDKLDWRHRLIVCCSKLEFPSKLWSTFNNHLHFCLKIVTFFQWSVCLPAACERADVVRFKLRSELYLIAQPRVGSTYNRNFHYLIL